MKLLEIRGTLNVISSEKYNMKLPVVVVVGFFFSPRFTG